MVCVDAVTKGFSVKKQYKTIINLIFLIYFVCLLGVKSKKTLKIVRRPTMSDLIGLFTQRFVSTKQYTFSIGDGNVFESIGEKSHINKVI